jgi:imidazolonepropionase-like amidohydrolase
MASATTIVNATVFDGERRRTWTSLRFTGGLITECSVVAVAAAGDNVIDARGGTVFPGLIDAHVHLVPGALQQSLRFGVTTVLDMFSKPEVVADAKKQAASNPGVADVRSSGVGATSPGGHPSIMYAPFPTLTSPGQAEEFVSARIAEGSDYLKIFAGTGGLWPSLDSDTIRALVAAAHARGLVVVAHVNSAAGVNEVVAAGVDVLAHVPAEAELDTAVINRIVNAGIVVAPTLATIENTLGQVGGVAVADDPRLADVLGERWRTRLRLDAPTVPARRMTPRYSIAESNARRLADAGATVLAGTDAPNPGTVFGASLHRELELLVRSGLSPAQALAAATIAPAAAFGLADRGRIAVGLRADLVLVSGDPLTEITASRAIERVWRGGEACHRQAFAASDAEARQLDAFDAQIAKAVAAVRQRRPPNPTR